MTTNGKKTLLLIDDNKRLIVTLCDFLAYEGFDVVAAQSGEEALEKLKQMKPDIIILDINMPGIGGIGFLHSLQQNNIHADCPILVFTARSAMEEFFSTLDVAGFISKPCSQADLLDKIKEILGNRTEATDCSDPKRFKVLLGEDDKYVYEPLLAMLEKHGVEYHLATTGGEIIESAAVVNPSLIILKDILPGMNGRVIVSLLRTMPSTKNIPIILYDDTVSEADEHRFGRHIPPGVSKYITSSEPADIYDALKSFL